MNLKVSDIVKGKIEPGDVLFVKMESATGKQCADIGERIRKMFPDNKVVVYNKSIMEIEIYKSVKLLESLADN